MGRDGVVGIATRYGLYGPGIELQRRRDFQYSDTPAFGTTESLSRG